MPPGALILVCNSHLDPVWLWEWEEGLAETLTTFRSAARFCEEFDGFVFNHNEALLYKWIETYEPELFSTISDLIAGGRWHVMGGWYLQPDCNMPAGESFVRQILVGKRYFLEKFETEPRTAVNFDPFGHTRGLVQILRKSGYYSYLFCRPKREDLELPADDFIWVGYDGSEVVAHLASEHYNSERGRVGEKIRSWLEANPGERPGLLLWGIGNHGGGPSREDLTAIGQLQGEETGRDIVHGTPEEYFELLDGAAPELVRHEGDLNPWAVGCYTSMALVKQTHRRLESRYYTTEKMVTSAVLQGLFEYPRRELAEDLEDLLFCEFHDILPGSSIPEVEAYALQRMDHGLEILSRLRARAFFSLLSGEPVAGDGEFPIYIYNPHPFDYVETVVCEFQPPEPNFNASVFLEPELKDDSGLSVPFQLEKESCNILVDQRKRIVFTAPLKASSMNRFSCRLKEVEAPSGEDLAPPADFRFISDECELVVNRETGLIDSYLVDGVEYLGEGSFRPMVMNDYPDPWGMKVRAFRDVEGEFQLLAAQESARFAGVSVPELDPVRVIEEGPVRRVVETLFGYNHSRIAMRYKLPRSGRGFEVEVRVYWMEKDRMLKLSIPTPFTDGGCRGQVACGVEEFGRHGEELVAQKWVGVVSGDGQNALTVINDSTYGFDFLDGELRLSLLRSPAYSGHPVDDDLTIVLQDRFEPRIDQGERMFRFRIEGGPAWERVERVDREATVMNEPPIALCCYPPGSGRSVVPGIRLTDTAVQLSAVKLAEADEWLILRFFEPTGTERETRVEVPALNIQFDVRLAGFEIRSIAVDLETKELFEVDLLERKVAHDQVSRG